MTIDTNIVIAHLAGDTAVQSEFVRLKRMGISLILPAVVEMETLAYPNLTPAETRTIVSYFDETYTSIPLDRAIAQIGGSLRRQYRIPFADAAIAATALYTNTPLITRNTKDFEKIPSLRIFPL